MLCMLDYETEHKSTLLKLNKLQLLCSFFKSKAKPKHENSNCYASNFLRCIYCKTHFTHCLRMVLTIIFINFNELGMHAIYI